MLDTLPLYNELLVLLNIGILQSPIPCYIRDTGACLPKQPGATIEGMAK